MATAFEQRIKIREEDPEFVLNELISDISYELEKALAANNINQAELARRLKRTPAWVSKKLRGKENLTLKTLISFAKALDREVHITLINRETALREARRNVQDYVGIEIAENLAELGTRQSRPESYYIPMVVIRRLLNVPGNEIHVDDTDKWSVAIGRMANPMADPFTGLPEREAIVHN